MVDLVNVFAGVAGLTNLTKTAAEKQQAIDVSDVWHMWDLLVAKYDLIEILNVLLDFAKDDDLKLVVADTRKIMEEGARELEKLMTAYAIPLPTRPPKYIDSTINLESVTDRYIFRRVFEGVKEIMPVLLKAFLDSTSPVAIKIYKKYLLQKMTLVDNFSLYGEAKGYLEDLPGYNPS